MTDLELDGEVEEEVVEEADIVLPHDMEAELTDVPFYLLPLTGRDQARKAGRKIGLCGQAPSNHPDFARFLVRAGIDSISVTPDSFLAVKRHVAAAEKEG